MKFELFKSPQNSQWYWRMVATNGQVIAVGGEGYVNRSGAVHGLNLVREHAATATAYEQQADGSWFIPT
ncbi:MAG: DUF1508 domain-containing protein [Comamonadaceae bacterium]|nr:MAG: DUF1508 domain-containing protein [Comamonadaceae bacterium]